MLTRRRAGTVRGWVIVKPGTSTVTLTVHGGSVPPDGQLLPAAAVVRVLVITLLPVSGLFTVTVPVTVTVPPTGMLPVQAIPVAVNDSVPDVAVCVAIGRRVVEHVGDVRADRDPGIGRLPGVGELEVYRTTLPGVVVDTFALFDDRQRRHRPP